MKYAVLALTLLSQLTFAKAPDQFSGTWKEIGYRCEGDTKLNPRPSSVDKFFTFNGDSYFHRVELYAKGLCTTLSSAGLANWTGDGTSSAPFTITPQAQVSVNCPFSSGTGATVDDFEGQTKTLTIKLDSMNYVNYLIVGGDDTYRSTACSNPILERVYQKQ